MWWEHWDLNPDRRVSPIEPELNGAQGIAPIIHHDISRPCSNHSCIIGARNAARLHHAPPYMDNSTLIKSL